MHYSVLGAGVNLDRQSTHLTSPIPSFPPHPFLPFRWLDIPVRMVGAEGLDGAKEAVLQYMFTPPWMTQFQANGTAGTNGTWDGSVVWPSANTILGAAGSHLAAGEALNFTALQQWFRPRYAAWQANSSVVVTVQDVVDILNTPGIWASPGGRKGQP